MRKISIGILFAGFLLPVISLCQGIKFEHPENWQSLLAKAKTEGKAIFIDCYTTWCAPCKKMDTEVYIDSAVGAFVNTHYISIKLQMDTTKDDSDWIQKWANTANDLKKSMGLLPFQLTYS